MIDGEHQFGFYSVRSLLMLVCIMYPHELRHRATSAGSTGSAITHDTSTRPRHPLRSAALQTLLSSRPLRAAR